MSGQWIVSRIEAVPDPTLDPGQCIGFICNSATSQDFEDTHTETLFFCDSTDKHHGLWSFKKVIKETDHIIICCSRTSDRQVFFENNRLSINDDDDNLCLIKAEVVKGDAKPTADAAAAPLECTPSTADVDDSTTAAAGEQKEAQEDSPASHNDKDIAVTAGTATTASPTPTCVKLIRSPLVFKARTDIIGIDFIDTVQQSFRADVFAELRLRCISAIDNVEAVEKLLLYCGLKKYLGADGHGELFPQLKFQNIVEYQNGFTREIWSELQRNNGNQKLYDYAIKTRVKGVWSCAMELSAFPWDVQKLNVPLQLNMPVYNAKLEVNYFFPSSFHSSNFQLWQVFKVRSGDLAIAAVEKSHPSESAAQIEYPRCVFSVILSRHTYYHVSNLMVPMLVLTLFSGASFAVRAANGKRMDVSDRLAIGLTLILTAVTFKFVSAEAIPQVSYSTWMDQYLRTCFYFLVLNTAANALFPFLASQGHDTRSAEQLFVILFYSIFSLYLLSVFLKVRWWKWGRNESIVSILRREQRIRVLMQHKRFCLKENASCKCLEGYSTGQQQQQRAYYPFSCVSSWISFFRGCFELAIAFGELCIRWSIHTFSCRPIKMGLIGSASSPSNASSIPPPNDPHSPSNSPSKVPYRLSINQNEDCACDKQHRNALLIECMDIVSESLMDWSNKFMSYKCAESIKQLRVDELLFLDEKGVFEDQNKFNLELDFVLKLRPNMSIFRTKVNAWDIGFLLMMNQRPDY